MKRVRLYNDYKIFKNNLFTVLFILIIFVVFMRDAEKALSQEPKERMELKYAEVLSGGTIDGQPVRKLVGDVQLQQGKATLFCDNAIQFLDEKRFFLKGNVQIFNRGKELFANTINYFEETSNAVAAGKAQLRDSSKILYADTLLYFDKEDKAVAKENVRIVDNKRQIAGSNDNTYPHEKSGMVNSEDHFELLGDRAEYLSEKGYAIVTGHPRFTRYDSSRSNELVITGVEMEMFDDGARIVVKEDVQIIRGLIVANCGSLEYLRDKDRIELRDNPTAQRQNDYITGKFIDLILDNNKVVEIKITNRAIVTSKIDSLDKSNPVYNLMTGEDIFFFLNDEKVDSVKVKGRATSYYHVIEEKEERGLNKVLGDEIKLLLNDGELKKIWVKSTPSNANGIFYPVERKEKIENELTGILNQLGLLDNQKSDTSHSMPTQN